MTDFEHALGIASPFDYLEEKLRDEAVGPLERKFDDAVDLDSRYVFPAEPRKHLSPYDCIA
jgi:hypothetical protein